MIALAKKTTIVEAAKEAILAGSLSLQDIATQHGISRRTLQYWLAQLGEEYDTLRKAWIDALLVDAGEQLERLGDTLDHAETLDKDRELLRLARARELWKRATWYAEKRDPVRYGVRQEISTRKRITVIVQQYPQLPHHDESGTNDTGRTTERYGNCGQPVDITAQIEDGGLVRQADGSIREPDA